MIPTLIELLGPIPSKEVNKIQGKPQKVWYDGSSYAACVLSGEDKGREYLVVSQCAHVCQRAVRFEDWIYIRTYHDGFHLFDEEMLFNVKDDPQELYNMAKDMSELCIKAVAMLDEWYTYNMKTQLENRGTAIDPMWTVLSEGGPFHANGQLEEYCKRLETTGRGWAVDPLKKRHPQEFM